MSALTYLILTKLKNRLKALIKSPAKLIYTIIIIALMVFTMVAGTIDHSQPESYKDIKILSAGIFALFTFMFILIAKNGFSTGASIFAMPDVNHLFMAPITPQRILIYGLFQQMGTSLLLGFLLLFQYSWLHNVFGVSIGGLVIILLGYALTIFTAQLTAMIIYCLTSTSEKARSIIKVIFYGIPILSVLAASGYLVVDRLDFMNRLIVVGNSALTQYFPVSGWIASLTRGALTGNIGMLVSGLLLSAAYIGGLLILLKVSNPDYYEDVLQTAEASYASVTAAKEGRVAEAAPKNVKVGKTGFKQGSGADTFYFKHLIENRRSRTFLLPSAMLIFTAVTIGFSFFMRDGGIIAVLSFATYMQMFSVALGRMTKELTKPFVYLVPEPAFKKLLYCIKEGFPGFIIEAMLTFIPVGIILGLPVQDIIACILARITFSLLFTAGNVVVSRVFSNAPKMLVMLFFMLTLVVLALPGIVLAIALSVMEVTILTANVTILLSLAICNIPVSLLALFLCRNMLEYAEYNY